MTDSRNKKFLFDVHNFDEPQPEEEEEYVEPTYSEEELNSARQEGHKAGREEALEEARISRDKKNSELLETIAAHLEKLLAQEDRRAASYETEAVALSTEIFNHTFPALNAALGPQEIVKLIQKVLTEHEDQEGIEVNLNPEETEAVQNHLKDLPHAHRLKIRAGEEIEHGGCDIRWPDGGARRTPVQQADEIRSALERLLAERGYRRQDIKSNTATEENEEAAPSSPEHDTAENDTENHASDTPEQES